MKKALILGISGQDGSCLAKFLLSKGYKVFGASRDIQMNSFRNLIYLNIFDKINLFSVAIRRLTNSLCVNNSKISKLLGWQQHFSVEEGIAETVRFYKKTK